VSCVDVTDVLFLLQFMLLAWPGWLYEVEALAVVREVLIGVQDL
jgi:hypothetical protein